MTPCSEVSSQQAQDVVCAFRQRSFDIPRNLSRNFIFSFSTPLFLATKKSTGTNLSIVFGGAGVVIDEHTSFPSFSPSKASSISSSGIFSMLKGFLLEFHDCWSEYMSLAEASIFEYAFKLGMQIAIETLTDK